MADKSEQRPRVLDYQTPAQEKNKSIIVPRWAAYSAIVLFAVGFYILVGMPRGGSPWMADRTICQNNLSQIGRACLIYANDHGNRFPDSLPGVLVAEILPAKVLICPASKDSPATGATTQAVLANLNTPGHCSYIYVGKGLTTAASANVVVAYEPLVNHNNAGMNVLFADVHVIWLPAPAVQAILDQVKAGTSPVIHPLPEPTRAP